MTRNSAKNQNFHPKIISGNISSIQAQSVNFSLKNKFCNTMKKVFKEIQVFVKISIEIMILNTIWTRIHWFWTEYHWKVMKLHGLIDLNHQNRVQAIKNRKIHPGKLSEFFSIFCAKFYFSHFFQFFSSAPWRDFRDFARSPMQSTLITAKSYLNLRQTDLQSKNCCLLARQIICKTPSLLQQT